MMTATLTSRSLVLEIAFNVRHLGGYRTSNGRETRPDIVRAASLHRLTEAGADALAGHGVATVVDLRSEREREEFRTPNLSSRGIRHVFAPVFREDASPPSYAEGFEGFAPIYRRFLETGRDAYRVLAEAVAESDGAVLFHCAAGKDRTGVAAALLLDLAGVADDEIVADYAVSERLLKEAFQDSQLSVAQRERMSKLSEDARAKLLSSAPEYMAETIAYVRGRWGSARGYFRDIGLDDGTIDRVRARMVW
jgi:protein-tyrosine phosphatase